MVNVENDENAESIIDDLDFLVIRGTIDNDIKNQIIQLLNDDDPFNLNRVLVKNYIRNLYSSRISYTSNIRNLPQDSCNICRLPIINENISSNENNNCLICNNCGDRYHETCLNNQRICHNCNSRDLRNCRGALGWYGYRRIGGKKSRKPRTHKKRNRRTNHKKRNNKRTHKI